MVVTYVTTSISLSFGYLISSQRIKIGFFAIFCYFSDKRTCKNSLVDINIYYISSIHKQT